MRIKVSPVRPDLAANESLTIFTRAFVSRARDPGPSSGPLRAGNSRPGAKRTREEEDPEDAALLEDARGVGALMLLRAKAGD